MSLGEIFAGVKTLMPPNVEFKVGAPGVYGEDGVPRVVWVPVSEVISSSRGHGGDPNTTGLFPGTPSIATREVLCECHVWAASLGLTESLRDIVHNALQKLIWGSYDVTSARWVNNDGQTFKSGHAYVMDVRIRIPVTRPQDFHLHATQFTQTCQMFLDGSFQTI